jgi:hypothetical protein
MKPDRALRTIRSGNEKLAEAVKAARKEVAKIESQKQYTPEARKAAADARMLELTEECASIRAATHETLAKLRDAAPTPGRLDPQEAGRIWRRLERRLEADQGPEAIAQDLVARGDREALQVLQEELPDYLSAAGMEPRAIERERRTVGIVATETANDEEKAHSAAVAEAERAAASVETNVVFVEKDGLDIEQIFGETPEHTIDLKETA